MRDEVYSTVATGVLLGLKCIFIQVEVCILEGLPGIEIVGNLSSEVREARERVKVALNQIGIRIPAKRVTINLSPANIRKEGTSYDLAIAVSILQATGILKENNTKGCFFLGELGLNGELKAIMGILPLVLAAKEKGFQTIYLPSKNWKEACVVEDVCLIGITNLSELLDEKRMEKDLIGKQDFLFRDSTESIERLEKKENRDQEVTLDFRDINEIGRAHV